MSEPLRTVNVGLIGLGTVGGGVARLIKSHHDEYLAAYGIDLKLTRACALAWEQAEAAGIEREAFTSDWHDVVTDPAVDIVVEANDRQGLLRDVSEVLTKEKLNVIAVSTQSKQGTAHMRFTAEVNNVTQLKRTLTQLHEVDGVVGARRA